MFQQFSAPITYTAGTGLNESPTYTFNIANTTVSAATYGSASQVPVFAVNAQGQLTSVTNTAIAINGAAVTGAISGQAGSVANALTAGTYLTSAGTYDGSAARTFAVDATSTNTASKVVARDASGNFAAGTITAALSGNATTATTATNTAGGAANQISYNTAAGTTAYIVAPTTAATYLNWTGSAFAYSALSLPNALTMNSSGTGAVSGTTFNGSAAQTISYNTIGASPLAGSTNLTTTGTVTTGTWSGLFGAVTGANLTNLTAGNLAGTIPSAVLGNSAVFIGTTSTALNRTSANQALTGILSATMPGATSGSVQVIPAAIAGTGTVFTLPATTGTAITTGDSGTVTNTMLAGSIADTKLSTISTAGKVSNSATTATNANTASAIVARDASGNFSAGTITASLSGNATTATTAANVNNGTLTMAVAGTGLSGSQTFTANQSSAATFTVTSNATNANTASTIVARDASGNFTAGTITAALSGNATTATTATQVANALTAGTYLTSGGTFTGAAARTFAVDATTTNTASKVVARDASGNFAAGTITASLTGNASGSAATFTSTSQNSQFNSIGVGTAGSTTAGEIRATASVVAFYSSDIKFKENVRDIPNAAATVKAIGGKLFDWKDDYIEEHGGEDGYFVQKADFGVIAQDVQAKFPVAVRTRPDGSLAVDYEKLSALALAANAEHEARIAKLEALVAKLIEGIGSAYGVAWTVLDAQYFGVAQRRRRIFAVGYLGDWRPAAAVLFERNSLSGNPAPSREKREGVATSVREGAERLRLLCCCDL